MAASPQENSEPWGTFPKQIPTSLAEISLKSAGRKTRQKVKQSRIEPKAAAVGCLFPTFISLSALLIHLRSRGPFPGTLPRGGEHTHYWTSVLPKPIAVT